MDNSEKSKTKSIGKLVILITMITVVIVSLITVLYIKGNKPNPVPVDNGFSFTLTYYDDSIPGSKSEIKVENQKVTITTTRFCSAVNCNASASTKTYNYSQENANKLAIFLKENFTNGSEIHQDLLSDKQKERVESITYGEYFFEANIEEYQYRIEYEFNETTWYAVYFKADDSVLVKKLTSNDDYDIISIDTYPLNFSKKNISILKEYVISELRKDETTLYKYSTLNKYEKPIFKSIVENNEQYLNNYENEAKLEFTISYDGIDCYTPVLYLYNDNTYEYYYTFSDSDKPLTPKTGKFAADMNQIMANLDSYDDMDNYAIYTIETADNTIYTTSAGNKEINDLLSSINVTLNQCLEQEGE